MMEHVDLMFANFPALFFDVRAFSPAKVENIGGNLVHVQQLSDDDHQSSETAHA